MNPLMQAAEMLARDKEQKEARGEIINYDIKCSNCSKDKTCTYYLYRFRYNCPKFEQNNENIQRSI